MSRIYLENQSGYDKKIGNTLDKFQRRVAAFPPGICPISQQYAWLQVAITQSCGKCNPCRLGLRRAAELMQQILDGQGTQKTLKDLTNQLTITADGAECAIGYDIAMDLLDGIREYAAEYQNHIENHSCVEKLGVKAPCVGFCPAHVDIPGYIALTAAGDYAGAIEVIRKDNPFPTACAMVCEHPCEDRCRRNIIDAPLNIRGLKKYAVDQIPVDQVKTPAPAPATGKHVAVIGGGPSGLTAAYFLGLMGHKVTVYESHDKLGGMLRYGIPNYRFPKNRLDEDTNAILAAGDITVIYNTTVGKDISVQEVFDKHDAMYVAIGAQTGKSLRIDGSDAKGVTSAVDILDKIGNGEIPDYTGKSVVVVGGGNVAMDCARSAVRCNAKEVHIVYRRRQEDMTALPSEVEAAVMEGIDLVTLEAPLAIEKDAEGNATALITQPQMIGPVSGGRPAPIDANKPKRRIPADVVMIAVGQDIVSGPFEEFGMPANRHVFTAGLDTVVEGMPGVFVGGDCATGPATAIRAIAAGKVAAFNIDEYLGFAHDVDCNVEIPQVTANNTTPTGRVNISERPAMERKCDFDHVEVLLTSEEAQQEAGRCLRCDVFGCANVKGRWQEDHRVLNK